MLQEGPKRAADGLEGPDKAMADKSSDAARGGEAAATAEAAAAGTGDGPDACGAATYTTRKPHAYTIREITWAVPS